MLIGNPMIFRELPFEAALAKTLAAGFDALELWPPQIAGFRTPALRRLLRREAESRGARLVRLNCADRPYFQMLQSPADVSTAVQGLKADVDAACDLGMSQVLTWEGRRPPTATAEHVHGPLLDMTVQMFDEACRYARERGVELTLEVHPFTLGVDIGWLVKLCDRLADLPLSVTYDCCHFGVGLPDGYLAAIDQLGPRIGHVHFSDSDCQSSELHFAPGTGCLDLEGVVAGLKRIGFAGTMMLDLWLYPLPEQGLSVGVPYVRQVCQELGLSNASRTTP